METCEWREGELEDELGRAVERRIELRLPVSLQGELEIEGAKLALYLANLSALGFRAMHSAAGALPGQHYPVSLALSEAERVNLRARLVWSKVLSSGTLDTGFEFCEPSETLQSFLRARVLEGHPLLSIPED